MFRYKEVDSAAIIFVFERCSMFFVCGSGGCVACSLVVVVEVLLAVVVQLICGPPREGGGQGKVLAVASSTGVFDEAQR